jgi:hypothetical protein
MDSASLVAMVGTHNYEAQAVFSHVVAQRAKIQAGVRPNKSCLDKSDIKA